MPILADATDLPPRIVLFDGVCGLCHGLVRLLVRIDRDRVLRYAPLQGDTAALLRSLYPQIPNDIDTAVLVEDGVVYLRSRAVIATCRGLGWPWRALSVLSWLPSFVTDAVYRLVARVRYRVFGKLDACAIPAPEQRELFLP